MRDPTNLELLVQHAKNREHENPEVMRLVLMKFDNKGQNMLGFKFFSH